MLMENRESMIRLDSQPCSLSNQEIPKPWSGEMEKKQVIFSTKNMRSKRIKNNPENLDVCPDYVCQLKQIGPDTSCTLQS